MLLELLTQRKAIEQKPPKKTVPLCRVLREEGVLSDPERLMEKARQVRSVFHYFVHELSILAHDRVDSLPCWLRKRAQVGVEGGK